jgi:AcrR family transcriptional regulator
MARPADPNAKIDLLRAAESVFVERGLDLAKVEEITDRAGRSKGAFYLHFSSKEDAFRDIVESMLARMSACIGDGIELQEQGGVAAQAEFLQQWRAKDLELFEFVWQNRGVMRLLFEGGKSAAFGYLIDEFAERHRAKTVQALAWGVREGMFRPDLDVELASLVMAGAYDRVARDLVRRNRKPDLAKIFAEVQLLLVGGLTGRSVIGVTDPEVKNKAQAPTPSTDPVKARIRGRRSA